MIQENKVAQLIDVGDRWPPNQEDELALLQGNDFITD